LRFLRAALRPKTSWISRGALADFVFLVAGGALVLPGLTLGGRAPFAWLPWDPWASTPVGKGIEIAALLSSAVVIVYAGLVLADKAAVTFWRSAAVPTEFMLSSLAMAVPTAMTLQAIYGTAIDARPCWLLTALQLLLIAAIAWHLGTARDTPGKAESLQRLSAKYGPLFYGGVLAVGTVLPLLLAVVAAVAPAARGVIGVMCLVLTVAGGFVLRLVWLRVGYFPPITGAIRPLRR
jgi:formate-dependent nitrite reductase membrane component NrfD